MAEKSKPAEAKAAKPRPYWHVDAKWIFGLLLILALAATLLVFNLWRLTERQRGIELGTLLVATAFSPQGLDDPADIEKLKQQELADPDNEVRPLPNLPITIPESDLAGASPRELRLKIFRQLIEPFYDRGPDELAKQYAPTPEAQEQFKKDSSLLSLFTAATHNKLGGALKVLVAVAGLLLAGTIVFSHRFGKLISPALIALLVSLPPLIVISGVQMQNARNANNLAPVPGREGGLQLGGIIKETSQLLLDPVKQIYKTVALIAVLLLTAAIIGKLIHYFRKRHTRPAFLA